MALYNKIPPALIVIAGLLGFWELIIYLNLVDPLILPSPCAIVKSIPEVLIHDQAWIDILKSLNRVLCSIFLSAIIGIPLGLYLGYKRNVYRHVEGLVHALRSIPATALFPLLLIVIGIGEASIITLATYPCILIIVVNTVNGVLLTNKRRLYQAQALGLSAFGIVTDVLFYEALPNIIDGLRTAISYALVLVIAVEMFMGGIDNGLGYKIYLYQSSYVTTKTYLLIIVASAIGIFTNFALTAVEKRLLHWLPNLH